ncbi:MAG: alpha-glucan family phosphorylase, partial [Chloroflexi bacterium]
TVFTTHTPVPAGNDTFPASLMETYFADYREALGIDSQTFLSLGQADSTGTFNMSVLAMKLAGERCAVSELHGKVARRMWHGLWPDLAEDQVPITHITNGIHVPSWVASEVFQFLAKYLGSDWIQRHDDPGLWQAVLEIPDEALWTLHNYLKDRLLAMMRESVRSRWLDDKISPAQMLARGVLHNPDTLTIAFARRFAEYKRSTLVFQDTERLKRILNNRWQPVQIIFAGKSHPADFPSKYLLRQVYSLAADPQFQGRIAFAEDYGMHLAHYLVQGVDVWLNTPRRLQEASGTSGMKAALNGVLHLSVRDGWWQEGYNGKNGWAIGDGPENPQPEVEDRADAEALYKLLEETIVPLYYDRDQSGIPHGWVKMIKEAMRSIVPNFCTHRMLKEYAARLYKIPALQPETSIKP